MKRGLVFCVMYLVLLAHNVFAQELPIDKLVESIRKVCLAPSEKGKYWDVKRSGQGGAKVNLKLLGEVNAQGAVTFTQGEWEGVQRVLQEKQADENARYRDCVEKLTPLFLDKLTLSKGSSISLSNLSGIWTDVTFNYDIQLQGENKKFIIYNDYYYVYGLKLVDAIISGDSLITTIEDINSRRYRFIFIISTPAKMTLKERIFSNSGNELRKISGEHIGQSKLNNLISVLRMDFENLSDQDISEILRQLQLRCQGGQGGSCVEVRNLENIQATRGARREVDAEIQNVQEDLQRTEECWKGYGKHIMDARWNCGSIVEIKQKLSQLRYQRMLLK